MYCTRHQNNSLPCSKCRDERAAEDASLSAAAIALDFARDEMQKAVNEVFNNSSQDSAPSSTDSFGGGGGDYGGSGSSGEW